MNNLNKLLTWAFLFPLQNCLPLSQTDRASHTSSECVCLPFGLTPSDTHRILMSVSFSGTWTIFMFRGRFSTQNSKIHFHSFTELYFFILCKNNERHILDNNIHLKNIHNKDKKILWRINKQLNKQVVIIIMMMMMTVMIKQKGKGSPRVRVVCTTANENSVDWYW